MTDSNPAAPTPNEPPNNLSELIATSLREPEALRIALGGSAAIPIRLLLLGLPAMAFVGVIIATFSGGIQFLVVPLKVVAGTVIAMLVCLPSLFVFSNLSGSRVGLRQAIGSMTLAVAVLAFVLLALAPVALIFSLSTSSATLLGWIYVLFLLTSAWFGGGALGRVFGGADPQGSSAGVWMALFVVVLLQLSTTFRPLLGEYEPLALEDKKIFIEHWLGRDERMSRE